MNYVFTESTISVLDRLQKDLRELIESLEAGKEPQAPAPAAESRPAVTTEEVRKVLAEKMRSGKKDAVMKLLEHFNAASLPEVDPADYAELLELGRKL